MSSIDIELTRRVALAAIGGGAAASLVSGPAAAAAAPADFAEAVEALRAAMVAGDGKALDRLLHPDLVYMHSSGHAQTKQAVMNDLAGKTFFASLAHPVQSLSVVDRTGLAALTVDQVKNLPGAKTRASRIKVMQTWTRTGRQWRLVGRMSSLLSQGPNMPAAGA